MDENKENELLRLKAIEDDLQQKIDSTEEILRKKIGKKHFWMFFVLSHIKDTLITIVVASLIFYLISLNIPFVFLYLPYVIGLKVAYSLVFENRHYKEITNIQLEEHFSKAKNLYRLNKDSNLLIEQHKNNLNELKNTKEKIKMMELTKQETNKIKLDSASSLPLKKTEVKNSFKAKDIISTKNRAR